PTVEAFHDYEKKLISYVLEQFTPIGLMMDNTVVAPSYTASSCASFRDYLRRKYADDDPVTLFGIPSFDHVDLPHFDPIYYPQDAFRIVKDPLLQEWSHWRSKVICDFLADYREHVRAIAPQVQVHTVAGCGGLRYNQLFREGIDFEERLAASDHIHMEESGWRPGVVEQSQSDLDIIMDERSPDAARVRDQAALRVSTDARWWKIVQNYGLSGHHGFWGEFDQASKRVAAAHNMAFGQDAYSIGSIGPLAANTAMAEDIRDIIDWGNAHMDLLTGRDDRIASTAVWRGTATLGFIRHRPVWEACSVEQMLFENHIPFTILFDGRLAECLPKMKVLILPGTECISDTQAQLIDAWVKEGGRLLLLGTAATRDERTRLRSRHAFEELFGGQLPELERIGPPHWVPELNTGALPDSLKAEYGKGMVALLKNITPPHDLDLTRDPYMPERQVMTKDILPPANETEIMDMLISLLDDAILRADGPRWTLTEFWKRGHDLLICCANLRKGHGGGPLTIHLGPHSTDTVEVYQWFEEPPQKVKVRDGRVIVDSLPYFAAVVARDVLKG
ncbi:hypothetical protein ACFL4W_05005, partial [Planctomycetota bacterium]